MQNMFTNYEDLSSVYVPNNEKAELENNKVIDLSLPKKEYDNSGKFVGYSWNYGETLTIPYSVNKVIYVEEDALVYDISGVSPSISTIGTFGQKAYNTADRKSWVCKTLDSSKYIWEEQDEFTYPENGKKPISIKFIQDVSDKFIEFSINILINSAVVSFLFIAILLFLLIYLQIILILPDLWHIVVHKVEYLHIV